MIASMLRPRLSATRSSRFLSADFCSPLSAGQPRKEHIISQSLARQGRQKEQEVRRSPLRTGRGRRGTTGEHLFPLRLPTSCHFLFVLLQRLDAAVTLRPLRPANHAGAAPAAGTRKPAWDDLVAVDLWLQGLHLSLVWKWSFFFCCDVV